MTPKDKKSAQKKRRGKGKNFSLWLNPEQTNELLFRTRNSGSPNPSAFIKSKIFDINFKPTYPATIVKADPELIRQLSWIGNNINQISRVCNRSRKLSSEQAASIYASLALIAEELETLSEVTLQ